MTKQAVFYHAGCPVCVEAEQNVALALDRADRKSTRLNSSH